MSEEEIASSDIYLQPQVLFKQGKKYLVNASSGKGKTSLLNFIYGSNANFDGSILYHTSYKHKSAFDLRKTKLSYIFQDLKLFAELTLMENIVLKNSLTNYKSGEEIEAWIESVGLTYKKDAPVKTLSLGQRQRVAVLRALCQPFDFLLLDEPFSHLDEKNTELLVTIINREVDKQQAGLILTSLGNERPLFDYDTSLNL